MKNSFHHPIKNIFFMLWASIPLRLPACQLHLHLPGEVFSASAKLTSDGQNAPSPGTPVPLGVSPKTFWGTYLIAWRRLRRRLRKRVGIYWYMNKYCLYLGYALASPWWHHGTVSQGGQGLGGLMLAANDSQHTETGRTWSKINSSWAASRLYVIDS